MLEHGKPEIQWMKIPHEFVKFNNYYLEFEQLIKGLNIVNNYSDNSEISLRSYEQIQLRGKKYIILFTMSIKEKEVKNNKDHVNLQVPNLICQSFNFLVLFYSLSLYFFQM